MEASASSALFSTPLSSEESDSVASSFSPGIVSGAPSVNVRSNGTTSQRRKNAGEASWLLGGWLAEKTSREYGMKSKESLNLYSACSGSPPVIVLNTDVLSR